LKQLPNLRRLNLNLGCEAEHADRIHSRSLGRGGLPPPNLSDEALSRLADLEQLEQLNLADYSFPSDGLRHLTRLKNLKALSLAFTNVDDEAIQHLAELQHLEKLDLSETGITPQGLERFSHLKNVRVIGLTGSRLIARGENHLIHWLHATERDIWSELPQLAPASPASIVTHVDPMTGVIKELVRDDRWQGSMPDEFGREPIIDQRIQAVLSDKQHCFVLVTTAAGHRENLKSGHTVTRHEKLTCSIYVFRLRDGSSAKIWQVPVDSAPVARVSASTLVQAFRLVEGGVTCNGAKFLMKEDEEATQSD
jgi:hypothetical protein